MRHPRFVFDTAFLGRNITRQQLALIVMIGGLSGLAHDPGIRPVHVNAGLADLSGIKPVIGKIEAACASNPMSLGDIKARPSQDS